MIYELLASVAVIGKAWRDEAQKRRRVSQADPVADTLDYCAAELARTVDEMRVGLHRVTVEQYAKLQNPPVSEQTVRNWITRGELQAERGARGGWVIDPKAKRSRRGDQEAKAS